MRALLAPSILAADFGRLGDEVRAAEAGGADWVHVDVMDGHFVPNLTMGPAVTRAARDATTLPIDVHLMIEAPERYLRAFAEAGASVITVHQEACPHLHRTVQQIKELEVEVGVAINPATPVETLSEILPDLDLVLIMSVNPGFGGQRFLPSSVNKVRRARALIRGAGLGTWIEVDGGVDASNAGALVEAGAEILVAGSSVYGHADGPAGGLTALREAAAGVVRHG